MSAKKPRQKRKAQPKPRAFETRPPFGFAAHPRVGAPDVQIPTDDASNQTRTSAAKLFTPGEDVSAAAPFWRPWWNRRYW